MALKTQFEDASFLSSPFVDEIANPGVPGTSNEEVERQAIRSNQRRLQHGQSAADFNKNTKAEDKPTPAPAPTPTSEFNDFPNRVKENRRKLAAAQGR